MSKATVSSKGQITLPVWARRELGIEPGAVLTVSVEDGRLVLERLDDWLDRLQGSLKGVYGDPDDYVREQREGWNRSPAV
ncbi:MAG TPA: AbrB/MazE/SpoVT family DNA-binding domain-containing protein [Actinomycetota bacterium]